MKEVIRDKEIRLRASAEEKRDFETEAGKLGISVSAFIRLLFKNWSDGIRFEREDNPGADTEGTRRSK